MLAVVKEAAREGAIGVREMDRPRPGPGQVLVRTGAASVCGSDLHIWHWAPAFHTVLRPPRVVGHEFAGRIDELGPGVEGWATGERVVAESILPCGRCPRCRTGRANICDAFSILGVHRDGAMAEYVVVDQVSLHRLPDELSFEQASLVEPLSVATHAVIERSGIRPGDTALVLGPGPIGQLVAQVARAAGARVAIAGVEADRTVRLAAAEGLGLGTIELGRESIPDGLRRLLGTDKVDVAFECAGNDAATMAAIEGVVKGGTVALVALYSGPITLELAWAVRRELSIQATYAGTWLDFERSIAFLKSGAVRVEPLIATYPLAEGVRAFEDALEQRVLKPVLVAG